MLFKKNQDSSIMQTEPMRIGTQVSSIKQSFLDNQPIFKAVLPPLLQ